MKFNKEQLSLIEIAKKHFGQSDMQRTRDLVDKIAYRAMWGKKRSDDTETDPVFEEYESKQRDLE